MRSTRHHSSSARTSRLLVAGGALTLALTIAGCSAVNMTGFDMPVFGLTKKSSEESDSLATASIPDEEEQKTRQAQGLAEQP